MALSLPAAALDFEDRALGPEPERTLPEAFEVLVAAWQAGDRGREVGLHLAFLAWYLLVEPPYLSGLDEARTPSADLVAVFNDVHAAFAAGEGRDPEVEYVFAIMTAESYWRLGDLKWSAAVAGRHRQADPRPPTGISPEAFAGRGFYGHYFAHRARPAPRRPGRPP